MQTITRWIKTTMMGVVVMTLFPINAIAAEAVLVHDIAPPHPRYQHFYQMVADVAKKTSGLLTIAINPGGKVLYPGQASLDAGALGPSAFDFCEQRVPAIDPSEPWLHQPAF